MGSVRESDRGRDVFFAATREGLCKGCGTPGDGPAAPQQGHRTPPLTPAAAPSHILK